MKNILIIDDIKAVRHTVQRSIESLGYSFTSAENGKEGLELFKKNNYDLVITDIVMPEMDGSELIVEMKRISPKTPVIAISGGNIDIPLDEVLKIAKEKADFVIEKPFSNEQLLAALQQYI